jgi:hypothetical protein
MGESGMKITPALTLDGFHKFGVLVHIGEKPPFSTEKLRQKSFAGQDFFWGTACLSRCAAASRREVS